MSLLRGRPRSPAVDQALREAVVRLLESDGYAAMSIEQVALAAKVSKSAIYRRWASKAEMVFSLVIHDDAVQGAFDHGSLAEDLRALTERVLALLSSPPARQTLPGLIADLRRDPLLAHRFHENFIEEERRIVGVLLDRAQQRKELVQTWDPADVHAQLLGAIFVWVFLLEEHPPPDLADRISSQVLAMLETGTQSGREA